MEESAPQPHELPQQPSAAGASSAQPWTGAAPVLPFREETAPMPRELTPPPSRFWAPGTPRDPSLLGVEILRREIEILRKEREAMLAEKTELITAKDLHAVQRTDADLRKRIIELLAKVAQQNRKEKETANASSPSPTTDGQKKEKEGQDNPPSTLHTPTNTGPASPKQLVSPRQPSAIADKPGNAKVVTEAPIDPLALAQSLFRAGDYAAALKAYRKLDKDDPKSENRVAIQYMMACCLRKLGKIDEASVLYREVANAPGSDFLAENAQWYLRTMKEQRELEAQLAELRERCQAAKSRKP